MGWANNESSDGTKHEGFGQFYKHKMIAWHACIWSALYMIWVHKNIRVLKKKTEAFPELFKEIQFGPMVGFRLEIIMQNLLE